MNFTEQERFVISNTAESGYEFKINGIDEVSIVSHSEDWIKYEMKLSNGKIAVIDARIKEQKTEEATHTAKKNYLLRNPLAAVTLGLFTLALIATAIPALSTLSFLAAFSGTLLGVYWLFWAKKN